MNNMIEEFLAFLEDAYLPDGTVESFPGGWSGIAASLASVFASYQLMNYCKYRNHLHSIKQKIQTRHDKRNMEEINDRIQVKLLRVDRTIPLLGFSELHAGLQDGSLKAWDVLIAFQNKAYQMNIVTNSVVEFIEDAEYRAERLDDLVPEKRGPLHGIPISLTESVGVEGYDSTSGFAQFIGNKEAKNSVLVQLLIEQGAVPFARTNLSQGQYSYECSNPIYGTTNNPHDYGRTSGGASGGEAALIGFQGSILGIGYDLGGSIRIPAHCCGITGFMCTPTRLSTKGMGSSRLGIQTLQDVYGPMGRDVDALVQFMKATLVPRLYELDPLVPRVPWDQEIFSSERSLTIGYYVNDGAIQPIPAVERAVEEAKACLETLGHKVVNFHPPNVPKVFNRMFLSMLDADKDKHLKQNLKDDSVDPTLKEYLQKGDNSWTSSVKHLMSRCFNRTHPIAKMLKEHDTPGDIGEWWDRNEEIEAYKREFVQAMKDAGIDCILCPTLPIPAWPFQQPLAMATVTYTSLYNVLGFPAGVVPAVDILWEDIEKMAEYPRVTDLDKFIQKVCKDSYGLPITVQIAGLPFQDETVLRLMKALQLPLLIKREATLAAEIASRVANQADVDVQDGSPDNNDALMNDERAVEAADGSPNNTEGTPNNPTEGTPNNPTEGTPNNSTEGTPNNSTEGTPNNPNEGTPSNPTEGTPNNPTGGTPNNPTGGTPNNPTEGTPSNPSEGTPSNPTEGSPSNPTEGTPSNPTEGTPSNPTEGTLVNPTKDTPSNPTESAPSNPTEGTSGNAIDGTSGNPTEGTISNQTNGTLSNTTEDTPSNPTEDTPSNSTDDPASNPTKISLNNPVERSPSNPIEGSPKKLIEQSKSAPTEGSPKSPLKSSPAINTLKKAAETIIEKAREEAVKQVAEDIVKKTTEDAKEVAKDASQNVENTTGNVAEDAQTNGSSEEPSTNGGNPASVSEHVSDTPKTDIELN